MVVLQGKDTSDTCGNQDQMLRAVFAARFDKVIRRRMRSPRHTEVLKVDWAEAT
jgi:hypothetical protein